MAGWERASCEGFIESRRPPSREVVRQAALFWLEGLDVPMRYAVEVLAAITAADRREAKALARYWRRRKRAA
jgi:hypothetical protein